MRILMVTPMLPRRDGAGAIPVLLHAELTALAERHEVTLVTIVEQEAADSAEAALDNLRRMGIRVQVAWQRQPTGWARWERRWRLATTWLRGRYPWRTVWFADPILQRALDELSDREAFDVVQVEDNAMGSLRYPFQAARVFTEHEVRRPRPIVWGRIENGSRMRGVLKELDWHRWPGYHASVWRKFDRVQVFSARDALAVKSMAPEVAGRVRINPFPVEPPPVSAAAREDERSILFVGNFTHPPNVDAALWLGREIMPLLRRRVAGVRLTIVGPDPSHHLHALARDDVVVTGEVPEVEPYFERAAVVVAPVRTGGGQRMKVLYALAMGKAVVTTARGADGLAIDGSEPPLVVADDAEGIASAVAALLATPGKRAELGRLARAHAVDHFSPSAYVKRLEAIYSELLPDKVARSAA